MTITYSEVKPWGRSYEEYLCMFALSEGDLSRRILGCGDGPASFNCVATRRGQRVVSIDPIYELSAAQIEQRIQQTCHDMRRQCQANMDRFVWNTIKSLDDLCRVRMAAMSEFLADFEHGKSQRRYLAHSLPSLPFADHEFDLVVCSHLLFLYSGHLSEEFHCRAIAEMCRVADEVRLFPLVDLDAKPSVHVNAVRQFLAKCDCGSEIVMVPYEFQRGGNQMMRIRRKLP